MLCDTIIAGEFVEKVTPLIAGAKNSIDICVFDWRWYPSDPAAPCQKFNQFVVQAVRRGVKVRAIVNSESVAQTLRSVGVLVKHHISAHLLHLKMMILDDDTVVTGSHNYTQSAFTANYELSVILGGTGADSEFKKFFDRLWQSQ